MRRLMCAAALLVLPGCGMAMPGAAISSATPSECAHGYSSSDPVLRLTNADEGQSASAHVCDSISIVLTGVDGTQWQSVQSSDEAVLEVVPLPLPHPPNGTEAVFLARKSGTATLTSADGPANCPPNAMCVGVPRWSVKVTVVP